MKITLESSDIEELILDDNNVEGNAIDIIIDYKDGEDNSQSTVTVSLTELMSACIAFESMRSRQLYKEGDLE